MFTANLPHRRQIGELTARIRCGLEEWAVRRLQETVKELICHQRVGHLGASVLLSSYCLI